MEEQMLVEWVELVLGRSRIDPPVREPFSHDLAVEIISRRELERLLNLAERLAAVRRALPQLDRERGSALERLGAARVRQRCWTSWSSRWRTINSASMRWSPT
jgi:hypothetical protein